MYLAASVVFGSVGGVLLMLLNGESNNGHDVSQGFRMVGGHQLITARPMISLMITPKKRVRMCAILPKLKKLSNN